MPHKEIQKSVSSLRRYRRGGRFMSVNLSCEQNNAVFQSGIFVVRRKRVYRILNNARNLLSYCDQTGKSFYMLFAIILPLIFYWHRLENYK